MAPTIRADVARSSGPSAEPNEGRALSNVSEWRQYHTPAGLKQTRGESRHEAASHISGNGAMLALRDLMEPFRSVRHTHLVDGV
jgi:hypothetical protein